MDFLGIFTSNCAYNSHVLEGIYIYILDIYILYNIYIYTTLEGKKKSKMCTLQAQFEGNSTFLVFWHQIYGKEVDNVPSILGAICGFQGGEGGGCLPNNP